MILLQSQDKFDELAVLDTATMRLTWHSRNAGLMSDTSHIQGHFSKLADGTLAILYKEDDILHLRVDAMDVELPEEVEARLERYEHADILTLRRADNFLVRWMYVPPIIDPPLSVDPTPFVEEEDFDFGVFVYNVVTDPRRRKGIYTRQ